MKLSIGIVGLPNVGKSTLFKVLTKQQVNIANYPFTTIDPNVGVVAVPDERLRVLAEINRSQKVVPAVVEFYDIAGLVKGAYKGEGLGNQFLSHVRDTQVIVVVLRTFENQEIVHVENSVDPLRDLKTINTELILKDLEGVEKRLTKIESEAKSGKKSAVQDVEELQTVKKCLEDGKLPTASPELLSLIRANDRIRELNLLTAKRQIYLLNGRETDASEELKYGIKELGGEYIVADLVRVEEIPDLITKAYKTLNLISFFTNTEVETRAWTIEKGTKAPEAAGVIHTDFQRKFIRAEVVNYENFVKYGGWSGARQNGLVRSEGKDYVFRDGDVVTIRHG